MGNAIFNIIIKNKFFLIKMFILIVIYLMCIFFLKKINSIKLSGNKKNYNGIRRMLYIFFVVALLILYSLSIYFRYIGKHIVSEYMDIPIYSIQIAIICEVIIQIPTTIKELQDKLSVTVEQLKNASINELLIISILDRRLYKVNDRPNKYCIIYGDKEDELIKQIKKSGISWKMPIRDICRNEQQSIYKNRVKEGYSTENMKNKISFIYIRINNKLIDSYANYILDMPKTDNK